MMKTIIAGGRKYNNYQELKQTLDIIHGDHKRITQVVSGKATGADTLGEQRAEENSIPVQGFPADRYNLGRKAGPIRNEQMAQYADALVAFRDGESRGTKGMIGLAHQYGLQVFIHRY